MTGGGRKLFNVEVYDFFSPIIVIIIIAIIIIIIIVRLTKSGHAWSTREIHSCGGGTSWNRITWQT
jgi:hypothetical protein